MLVETRGFSTGYSTTARLLPGRIIADQRIATGGQFLNGELSGGSTFGRALSTRQNLVETPSRPLSDLGGGSVACGGLSLRGLVKRDVPRRPLVSVVTVVLNAATSIEETIRSVLFQSYDNVEYVIVDGGSTDGTLDIIKAYEDGIDLWISAPDGGIYQAMNRALSLIRGRYVNFLNADDHYVQSGTLRQVIDVFQEDNPQVVVGSVLMLSKATGYGYIRHNNLNKYYYLFRGLPQQAFFYDAAVFESARFDETLPVASDLDFYLDLLLSRKCKVRSVAMPVVVFNTGATSADEKRLQADRDRIVKKHFSYMERFLLHNWLFERLLVRNELRAGKPGLLDRVLRKLTRQ